MNHICLSLGLSVCPSVHIVSLPWLPTPLSNLDNISHNCWSWPKGVPWPWTKVISLRSRSQCTYTQKQYPGSNSSFPCWICILFDTIVIVDPRVWHDLDLRSYLQCQGYNAHITAIHVRPITLYFHVDLCDILHKRIRTLIQGHIAKWKFKVCT